MLESNASLPTFFFDPVRIASTRSHPGPPPGPEDGPSHFPLPLRSRSSSFFHLHQLPPLLNFELTSLSFVVPRSASPSTSSSSLSSKDRLPSSLSSPPPQLPSSTPTTSSETPSSPSHSTSSPSSSSRRSADSLSVWLES